MTVSPLDQELNRLAPRPQTPLQQDVAAKAGAAWAGFKRDLNPFRSGATSQQQPAQLGIGGLRPTHTPGAAVAAAPPAAGQPEAARENLTGTPAPPSTPANPVATPPVAGPTNMITAGAQGQDGYGMAKRGLSDGTGAIGTNRMGAGQVGGYSFRGTGADFASFARQPTMPALQDGNTVASQPAAYLGVRDRHEASKAAQTSLAGLDPRSGWGWKGRQDLYKHQQGLDQRASEEQTQAQLEAARILSGQQQAAAALAQGQQQFNAQQQGRDVDMQAKQFELGFKREEADARRALMGAEPGTPEYERAARHYATLTGKLEQQRPTYEKLRTEGMGATSERLVQINPDGSATEVQVPPSAAAIAAQRHLVKGMKDKQRQAYLDDLARTDPAMFNAVMNPAQGERYERLPTDRNKLVVGQIYETAVGAGRWNGEGFIRVPSQQQAAR